MTLDPAIARLKRRMLQARYEICLARARHFTAAYRATAGLDPALRNAIALQRTLVAQQIAIHADERLAGSKTERLLAGPLSVERGDFLRVLALEGDILARKRRPFVISEQDRRVFRGEILPYWSGRTLRDRKAAHWQRDGLIDIGPGALPRQVAAAARLARYVGLDAGRRLLGANLPRRPGPRRLWRLARLGQELARNSPAPGIYCFDMQGHLSLGVDRVVARGMAAIIADARQRLEQLQPGGDHGRDHGRDHDGRNHGMEQQRCFLQAVIVSLEAAIHYAGRFAALARELLDKASAATASERQRLERIATACDRVPRDPPRSFHEALQAVWLTLLVGEIQHGTHEVFAVGRLDQYLYPLLERDLRCGALDRDEARSLLQELLLKLSANVEPVPEMGMEANGVLGNSQHVVTIGGLDADGRDATNELTHLVLEAFEELGGAVCQLAVRVAEESPDELLRRAVGVFRRTSGIAFHGDRATIAGLVADGMHERDARDYCIVGCVETSGQSNTHGCPGGHELVLPVLLLQTLSRGRLPPPGPGQRAGLDVGPVAALGSFEQLCAAFRRQLGHAVERLISAVAGKDRAYAEQLPAPYVSALTDGCIASCRDITRGGARYDFTSLDVRGLATLVDSLAAIDAFVYRRRELTLAALCAILETDFAGHEALRQRLIHRAPKFGSGDATADQLALEVLGWIAALAAGRRNVRGGRFRVCYYSYGNHVIDGLLLGATPDGRRRGDPIANGVSPSDLATPRAGPTGPLRSVARFPPAQVSSGIALNLRFSPRLLRSDQGIETFAAMLRSYFRLGGMQLQPNVVSTETLRQAQAQPERHRDLVVKVSGYSAYFTDLGRSIQEDIIARHEHDR